MMLARFKSIRTLLSLLPIMPRANPLPPPSPTILFWFILLLLRISYDSFDFGRALNNAWAVVNWNSNPGVESVIAGVPAFVGESSLAAPVANLNLADIEKPLRPDRQQWLNDLAYTEWTVNEIAQGIPFDLLLPKPN